MKLSGQVMQTALFLVCMWWPNDVVRPGYADSTLPGCVGGGQMKLSGRVMQTAHFPGVCVHIINTLNY